LIKVCTDVVIPPTGSRAAHLLKDLNRACGPNFKGCDWQTSDQVEIDRFLNDPLNGKPFCNRMMYGVLLALSRLWMPENEGRIPKDLPIFVMDVVDYLAVTESTATIGWTQENLGGVVASMVPKDL
jgi:hypothetical protein